jgi:hypothetical protein
MSEALHTVFIDPDQARAAIAGQIGPFCRAAWERGVQRLAVTIEPEEDARTAQQNRFYWGVLLKEISEQAAPGGQKWSAEAWHELFKRQFLPRLTKRIKVAGRKSPVVTTTIGTTRGLSVKKMSTYMEQVSAFAVNDLHVVFSASRWEEYR